MIRQQRRKEKDEDARVRRAYQTPQELTRCFELFNGGTRTTHWGMLLSIYIRL